MSILVTYQEMWNRTARALGYTSRIEKGYTYLFAPNGEELAVGRYIDFTRYEVVQHMEYNFGLKWNTRPYSKDEDEKDTRT